MKTAALLAAASILLASSLPVSNVSAQSAPPTSNVPPPPGMNDPGVQPVAPPAKVAPATTQNAGSQPALPSMQDGNDAGNGKHMSLPEVSVHEEGENIVQEYSRGGMVYMVVVTPRHGIQQTYMVDPDGSRHLQPGAPPVQPVMYKVLEWGKSKPAEADSSESAPDTGG